MRGTVVDHDEVRRAHGFHALPVRDVVAETADAATFVLDVPEELGGAFRYRAGQFCTFRVVVEGEELLRCYSMSSAPETDGDLAVTVKRVPGGRVSNWLLDNVSPGDLLEATRPAGVFCADDRPAPLVALCGGSGVTPVMSITKSVLASTERPVHVMYANRDPDSVIFGAQLAQLEADHPDRLRLHHHLDSDGGYLEPAAITDFVEGLDDADFYVCGPGPFMDLVESTLLDRGIPRDRIAQERFVEAGQPNPLDTRSDESAAGTDTDVPAEVTVILQGKRTAIAYRAGDTLLETARRGGVQAPYSCQSGNCATCMALLHDGSATMHANNALTPEEVEEGWVLTCQAVPSGPTVTVEYESF